jgi:hypothetical protein
MTDLAQQTGMSDGAKEVAERDARWIGDFADQLTVAIALREWDTAVDLVEQGTLLPLFIVCLLPPLFDVQIYAQVKRSSIQCLFWQLSSLL